MVVEPNPRAELIRRLQAGMATRGFSQAALAASAGVAKATISNALNPARGSPSAHTLNQLAEALGITGAALAALHRLRERADSRTRRLDAYLAAAARAADEHPYPGVIPGTTPPLAEVYLRQVLTAHEGSAFSAPAEQVLGHDRMCVVLAGPGGGKSSLLRRHTAHLIGAWRAGLAVEAVPVLIRATALPGRPLTEALAHAVTAELSAYGLVEELPAAFFRDPPDTNLPWLVMVDGVDEITSPQARRQVFTTLTAVSADDHSARYRFAVTTRPLPRGELSVLDETVPCYELLPFTSDDLPQVVHAWFSRLRLPAPDERTTQFLATLERARLSELARTPLMIAMLCQLHATEPHRPLPTGRGHLYRDFTELLHRRLHEAGVRAQARLTLGHYGEQALTRAERVLDHLPDLLEHVAAAWHKGNRRAAVDIAANHPEAAVPRTVPESEWRGLLDASLRRSGLMTAQSGELVFLHHTIQEYLAAGHATRDETTREATLAALFDNTRKRDRHVDVVRLPCERNRYWQPPPAEASYVGFVLDALSHDPATQQVLLRLVNGGGLPGLQFIADQMRLGTAIPPRVLATTVRVLAAVAHGDPTPRFRLGAAIEWARLDSQRAASAIAGLAGARNDIPEDVRLDAAHALVVLNDPRAASLLTDLARDRSVRDPFRRIAVCLLMDVSDSLPPDLVDVRPDKYVSEVSRILRDSIAHEQWPRHFGWSLSISITESKSD